MKKILLTGADGFIGSHLTELLLRNGYQVRALSYYNSFGFNGWLEGIAHDRLEIVAGDVRDPHLCRELVKGCDLILNLAALIAIPFSYRSPDLYVETNIKGALNLCQAARDAGNLRIVHTSTSEVYGTAQFVPISETHPKQPQSPYSASKIGADAMALSFFHAFDLPVSIARPFNTYGPRQSARAVIPSIITQIAAGKKSISLGDTSPTRDFTYVTDTCQGILEIALNHDTIGQEINIASGHEISISDLFGKIKQLMLSDAQIQSDSERLRPSNSEVYRLLGDNTLLKQITGFSPATTLEEGLQQTINWFMDADNLKLYKTDIYNI